MGRQNNPCRVLFNVNSPMCPQEPPKVSPWLFGVPLASYKLMSSQGHQEYGISAKILRGGCTLPLPLMTGPLRSPVI